MLTAYQILKSEMGQNFIIDNDDKKLIIALAKNRIKECGLSIEAAVKDVIDKFHHSLTENSNIKK